MTRHLPKSRLAACLFCLVASSAGLAEDIRVAVASNFAPALRALAADFQVRENHSVTVITGSSGKLFAQIRHGAPFDLFLSADADRPKKLEQLGIARPGSRFTYAVGRLALWSPDPDLVGDSSAVLDSPAIRRLAIANPRLAPYGLAASEVLKTTGHWSGLQSRLVRGENIAQTYHFVRSGNTQLGFVALSQLTPQPPTGGSLWPVPAEMHSPIEQQLVRITDKPAARAFVDFLRSPEALARILEFGYAVATEPATR